MPAVAKLPESRTYNRLECITFRKTAEKFGGLSNMAGGYLLNVNGVKILTSEALYQACRFPHLPEVQRLIIAERSPMTAKMKSKPYRDNSRVDWDIVRTKVMRWCLQVKLVQNWEKFSELLLETGDLPIVEDSRKDDFWGAKPEDEEILTGANVLGRLLMQVREQIKTGEITSETIVKPLPIQNFLLYGQEISSVSANSEYHLDNYRDLLDFNKVNNQPDSEVVLPDTPMLESDFNG
ncbi:MAG: NADAR family protein, partial [Pseudanabaena sp.]